MSTSITYEDYWAMMVDFSTIVQFGIVTFQAIFDNGHKDYMESQTGEIYSSYEPILVCRTTDVATISQEDQLTINSTIYAVRDIQPDGWGITKLVLKKIIE